MTDVTAAHTVERVRQWCDKTQEETTEWLKQHNPDCHCEVGTTYLEAVEQVRALLPGDQADMPSPSVDDAEVLARILDPAAFDPDAKVAASRRTTRQAAARVMADRAIDARYVRQRGFWGCACEHCLRCTGRCPRCGLRNPASDEPVSLCGVCERAVSEEVAS